MKREKYHPVKIGTGPRECVWVKFHEGNKVGAAVRWRRLDQMRGWNDARIWMVGPPPEYMSYLEL